MTTTRDGLPMMARLCAISVCCAMSWETPAAASQQDIRIFYSAFLQTLDNDGPPILFVQCLRNDTKAVLFVPLGSKNGRYGEFERNGLQANGAEVSLSHGVAVKEYMNGGIGAYKVEDQIVNGLVNGDFRLVWPGNTKAALMSRAASTCAAHAIR